MWRDIFLKKWDDPRNSGSFVEDRVEYNWKKLVQDRELLRRIQNGKEYLLEDLVSPVTSLSPGRLIL